MSYRALWGRIKATEERLGETLLKRNIGGKSGGGSELTDFAKQLMEDFKKLHPQIADSSDGLFEELMPESLKDGKHHESL